MGQAKVEEEKALLDDDKETAWGVIRQKEYMVIIVLIVDIIMKFISGTQIAIVSVMTKKLPIKNLSILECKFLFTTW